MEAPLIFGMTPEEWTVAHDDGTISRGSGGRVAFTSRKAFEAAGDIPVMRDRGRGEPMRASSEAVQLMSLVPNSHVLIVDEAWGWKFPGKCPQMNSAEDGRAVLGKLLQGQMTVAQREIAPSMSTYLFFVNSTPERQLRYITELQNMWGLYRRAESWSPNNRSDDEGNFVVHPLSGWCWVLTSLEETPIIWSRDSSYPGEFPPNTELMVLEGGAINLDFAWIPEPATRTAPDYLLLT